jgi:hypothetical protein
MTDELKQWEYDRGYDKGKADILDVIREEIVELQKDYHEYGWAFDDVLEIIDKYKAESEG